MVILVFSNKLQINQKNLEGFKVFTNSPAYNSLVGSLDNLDFQTCM